MAKKARAVEREADKRVRIYRAAEWLRVLAHGDKAYPVVNGQVNLPTNEYWYGDLVESGVLVPAGKKREE